MKAGLIPTIVGTGVTAAGIIMKVRNKKNYSWTESFMPVLAAGAIGFGVAHVILGTIDLVSDK